MSIPKVVGLEQEYAITIRGETRLSPFDASCMLVNAYARMAGLREPGMRINWDYGHETPYQDIRGELFGKATGGEVMGEEENRLINAALPNGARLYTDHAHPEYSTPECLTAREAVACDKAGEGILLESLRLVSQDLPSHEITLFKNNTDHQGHSYGCHENYLMEAQAHEECLVRSPQKILRTLVPFLVTRQIFAGAGKVGTENISKQAVPYQISQRADFIETLFGLETMQSRALVNTRGEHHGDARKFRRLHLILGDANMCEFAGFLKIGSTQIVLQMLEDGFIEDDFGLKDPVTAIKQISESWDCPVEMADGRNRTASEVQRAFLEKAREYSEAGGLSKLSDEDLALECWEYALDGLEKLKLSPGFEIEDDPMDAKRRMDWVLKLWLINRYRRGERSSWDHPHHKVLDLHYHNIDRQEGVFYRLQDQALTERILKDEEISWFMREPPTETRAYFRGKCVGKFAREINLVNWEVVGFDQGDVCRMVPLLNPLKGTREQFEQVLERARTAGELLSSIAHT